MASAFCEHCPSLTSWLVGWSLVGSQVTGGGGHWAGALFREGQEGQSILGLSPPVRAPSSELQDGQGGAVVRCSGARGERLVSGAQCAGRHLGSLDPPPPISPELYPLAAPARRLPSSHALGAPAMQPWALETAPQQLPFHLGPSFQALSFKASLGALGRLSLCGGTARKTHPQAEGPGPRPKRIGLDSRHSPEFSGDRGAQEMLAPQEKGRGDCGARA